MQVLDGDVRVEDLGTHQQIRIRRRGLDVVRELPTDFRVVRIDHDGPLVQLYSQSGQIVQATPGQLASPGSQMPAEMDPEHQSHLLAELLDSGTLPAHDATDLGLPSTHRDSRLGVIHFDPAAVQAIDVPTSFGLIPVSFHRCGVPRVRLLMPHVHQILDDLPSALQQAVSFLWSWGAPSNPTPMEESFRQNFGISGLTICHSGAFALDLSDDQTVFAESFLEGYWPKIHFQPDGTPIFVTIEC